MLPFSLSKEDRRALLPWAIGGAILLLVCLGVFILILSGKTRRAAQAPVTEPEIVATTTASLIPRHLDGVLVNPEDAAIAPWAVMIDNQVDARPQAGLAAASVVIESPVEGGITRIMALFAATSTLPNIGPIRSARPYFVDWASAWNAAYFHVGGSPDALDQIKAAAHFKDANEMYNGWAFWRAGTRTAPHNILTSGARMQMLADRKGFASSTLPVAWHFLDAYSTSTIATSTRLGGVTRAVIAYGGSYSVTWKFDAIRDVYTRWVSGRAVKDANGSDVEADNVIVIKTDSQVLDEKGRLHLRTAGSGDALAYRDGNKYPLRWRRSPGEIIRLEDEGGTEFLLRPGKTWIQVATDDTSFAGLEK